MGALSSNVGSAEAFRRAAQPRRWSLLERLSNLLGGHGAATRHHADPAAASVNLDHLRERMTPCGGADEAPVRPLATYREVAPMPVFDPHAATSAADLEWSAARSNADWKPVMLSSHAGAPPAGPAFEDVAEDDDREGAGPGTLSFPVD